MHTMRQLAESVTKTLGLRSQQRICAQTEPLDITSWPTDPKVKFTTRELGSVGSITVHVTDVTGGFGVSSKRVKAWSQVVEDPDASWTLALLERYQRTPYHWIASREIGVVHNHNDAMRTAHGHHGNKGLGLAIDCGHDEELGLELVLAGREALRSAILGLVWHTQEPITVAAHRCYSSMRLRDPGPRVWEQIVIPTLADFPPKVARIDYEAQHGSGRPIPTSWDPDALFDAAGRRVRAA